MATKPAKVFDISKPGKSAPSSSSKPIIVSNRPILKDPMMVSDQDDQSEDKKDKVEASSTPISHLKIVPITPDDNTDDAAGQEGAKVEVSKKTTAPTIAELAVKVKARKDAEAEKADEDKSATEQPSNSEADEPEKAAEPVKPEKSEANKPDDKPEAGTDAATNDSSPDEPNDPTERDKAKDGTKAADEDETAKKEQERAEELQKLATSHKYYLPINQVEKRRNKRAVWLGVVLVIVLGLAWADVALDAGLISIPGVKAPTHFFK